MSQQINDMTIDTDNCKILFTETHHKRLILEMIYINEDCG